MNTEGKGGEEGGTKGKRGEEMGGDERRGEEVRAGPQGVTGHRVSAVQDRRQHRGIHLDLLVILLYIYTAVCVYVSG